MKVSLRDVPTRLATGGFILHAGLGKWNGREEQGTQLRAMAANAFPFVEKIPAQTFLKLVSVAEVSLGAALLAPFVPNMLAGSALTAFSGSLLAMYLRTPVMHLPGSIWPTAQGTAVAKDVWMLGIGAGLVVEGATERR